MISVLSKLIAYIVHSCFTFLNNLQVYDVELHVTRCIQTNIFTCRRHSKGRKNKEMLEMFSNPSIITETNHTKTPPPISKLISTQSIGSTFNEKLLLFCNLLKKSDRSSVCSVSASPVHPFLFNFCHNDFTYTIFDWLSELYCTTNLFGPAAILTSKNILDSLELLCSNKQHSIFCPCYMQFISSLPSFLFSIIYSLHVYSILLLTTNRMNSFAM